MNKVIVIGGDHHNTLGVIRGLGEKGLLSDLIVVSNKERTFVQCSKYVRTYKRAERDKDVVNILLKEYKNEIEKPVVICCSDSSSGAIDDSRNELCHYFYLPGAKRQGRIAELMNKERMIELAKELGLKVPQTSYLLSNENEATSSITLPCIIKPLVSREGNKEDIRICRTKRQFINFSHKLDIRKYQIQDYIDKEFEYQLIGCSTNKEVIIPGVSIILRPCKGSNTSFLHYRPVDDNFCDMEKCKEFVRRTGYYGLFSLEFIRDKNGNDYFMEINFRNDGNAICVTAAGVNLPFIWYLNCIGEDYRKEAQKMVQSVYVMPDMAELKLLLTFQISFGEYISDLKKTCRFMEYDKYDMKPFWKMIYNEIVKCLPFI